MNAVRHHPSIGGSGKAICLHFQRIPLFGQGVFRFARHTATVQRQQTHPLQRRFQQHAVYLIIPLQNPI